MRETDLVFCNLFSLRMIRDRMCVAALLPSALDLLNSALYEGLEILGFVLKGL